VTGHEEATADVAGFLKPNLADGQVVKQVKFYVKNQRDCGAASAVGAATVAISLLIGDGKVTLDAFYVLLNVQALLIGAAEVFSTRAAGLMDRDRGAARLAAAIVTASVLIAGAGSYLTSQLKQHESGSQ
jgi:hypothetical protein